MTGFVPVRKRVSAHHRQPRNNKRKIRLFRESSGRGFRDCTAACTRARRSTAPAPGDPTASLFVVCRLDLLCVLCVLCGSSLLISTTEDTEDTEKPQRTRGTGATPHPVDPKHFSFLVAAWILRCVACSPLSSSQFLSVLRGESLFRAKRERYQRRHGRSRHSPRLPHSKARKTPNCRSR